MYSISLELNDWIRLVFPCHHITLRIVMLCYVMSHDNTYTAKRGAWMAFFSLQLGIMLVDGDAVLYRSNITRDGPFYSWRVFAPAGWSVGVRGKGVVKVDYAWFEEVGRSNGCPLLSLVAMPLRRWQGSVHRRWEGMMLNALVGLPWQRRWFIHFIFWFEMVTPPL